MKVVLAWLGQQASLLYLVSLIGALAYAVAATSAKRKRDAAQFSLEREIYQQQTSRSWIMSGLFLTLGAMVFLLKTLVFPAIVPEQVITPTPPVAGLFTPTPEAVLPLSEPVTTTSGITASVVMAISLTPTPTSAPEAEATATQPDCPSPNAQIIAPVAGSDLSGVVEVQGTATVNAFSFYKFEVIFPNADIPTDVAQYNVPVENGILGYWDVSDPAQYPPGAQYRFRLVVVDIYGNTTACTIPVQISAPEATPQP